MPESGRCFNGEARRSPVEKTQFRRAASVSEGPLRRPFIRLAFQGIPRQQWRFLAEDCSAKRFSLALWRPRAAIYLASLWTFEMLIGRTLAQSIGRSENASDRPPRGLRRYSSGSKIQVYVESTLWILRVHFIWRFYVFLASQNEKTYAPKSAASLTPSSSPYSPPLIYSAFCYNLLLRSTSASLRRWSLAIRCVGIQSRIWSFY